MYIASLKTPTHPSLVADKILEVADGDSWKLRHPVGSDSIPFLEWRKTKSDEEWVDCNSVNDEDWYAAVSNEFGIDAKS